MIPKMKYITVGLQDSVDVIYLANFDFFLVFGHLYSIPFYNWTAKTEVLSNNLENLNNSIIPSLQLLIQKP